VGPLGSIITSTCDVESYWMDSNIIGLIARNETFYIGIKYDFKGGIK
jgi:hypothetical protein